MRRTTTLTALVLVAVLTACGGNSDDAAGGDHNDADVEFATQMIPHHEQAVEMAELAGTRANSPQVQELAKQIAAAQAPEIATMTGWLETWDEPLPGEQAMEGMDHGGQDDAVGMMSADEMSELESATGAEFDRQWLTMMTEHHEGAVEMAATEIEDGSADEAVALARTVTTTQEAEIARMRALLQG